MNRFKAAQLSDIMGLNELSEIDEICDAFEEEWRRGKIPRIEDYLLKCNEHSRLRLFSELVLVEREFSIRSGRDISRFEYQSRFPAYSTVIESLEFTTIDDRVVHARRLTRDFASSRDRSRIARFELREEVGSGASGTVWKAYDPKLCRNVAIKLSREQLLSGAERERFAREGQHCAQMQHSSIVSIHEVGEFDGRGYIVTDFIEGVNLRDCLREKLPEPRPAAELTIKVARAIQHAHDRGVIHRDLKPANILIDRDGHPYVADFGLAKSSIVAAHLTTDGHIIGTPAYMAPEQARGDASSIDCRSDVYGIGSLLYEMLSGRPLFDGEVVSVLHQVVHSYPRRLRSIKPSIPRDLETICHKAIDKLQSDRYASAGALADDLQRFLDGREIAATRTSLILRTWRMVKRRPAGIAVIVLTVSLLLCWALTSSIISDRNRIKTEKLRLEGYQHVRIATVPAGAVVAITPADHRTNGPPSDAAGRIQPLPVTPCTVELKPGNYFIETAIYKSGRVTHFAEVTRLVPRSGDVAIALKEMHWSRNSSQDEVQLALIPILPTKDVHLGMILMRFDEKIRLRHPNVPTELFVDISTEMIGAAAEGSGRNSSYDFAVTCLERHGKRLPTAEEYDAICEQIAENSSDVEVISGLSDSVPEWTATRYSDQHALPGLEELVSDLLVVKGFQTNAELEGYIKSSDGQYTLQPRVGPELPTKFRGVVTANPRLLKL